MLYYIFIVLLAYVLGLITYQCIKAGYILNKLSPIIKLMAINILKNGVRRVLQQLNEGGIRVPLDAREGVLNTLESTVPPSLASREAVEVIRFPKYLQVNYNRTTLFLPYDNVWSDVAIHLKEATGYRKLAHPLGVPLQVPARELGGLGYHIFIDDMLIEVDENANPAEVVRAKLAT